MFKLTHIKSWKTTILGIAAFGVGLWQFVENNDMLSYSMVVLGTALILSPDKIIDALIEKIKQ